MYMHILTSFDHLKNLVELNLVDLGSLRSVGIELVAELLVLGKLDEAFDKFLQFKVRKSTFVL